MKPNVHSNSKRSRLIRSVTFLFPIPITSRAVNVMGKHGIPLRLHCECDIRI